MQHSNIVGGSTAKRVINCPGSVALVNKMPPKPSSEFADRGTLLHDVIAEILGKDLPWDQFIGTKYNDQVLTQELFDEKMRIRHVFVEGRPVPLDDTPPSPGRGRSG